VFHPRLDRLVLHCPFSCIHQQDTFRTGVIRAIPIQKKGNITMTIRILRSLIMFAMIGFVVYLAGCSGGNDQSTFNPVTGTHPTGWSDPTAHGAIAKSRAAGFSSCQECHGAVYAGGLSAVSCFTCHGVQAPHAPSPWRGEVRTHTNTDQGNAAVCAQCHRNGANSSVQPSPPATAGTPPGCFNNTLCHATAGHPAGWSDPTQHGTTAEQDFPACKTCHGQTYQGGSATTTCYQCHNGPGLDHPALSWVVLNHKTAALSNSVACQKCHGADYLGGGSRTACRSCHMEDRTKVHMLAWYPNVQVNHRAYVLANGTSSCATQYCHGANLTGVAQSGPSCSTCHTWPFTSANCGSCHGLPPAGSAFPDTAGRHSAHTVLGSYIDCNSCHTGAGSGTASHQNGIADTVRAALYNAKSGAAAFNGTANTCSNVSCHGGQTTPGWLTGSITVNTQCTSCHASGTTQYNSYNSGQHSRHVSRFACTVCHDTMKLAVNHFTTLNTTVMEGPASATTATVLNYNGTSCNPGAGGLTGCHSSKNW
jgi:predicted CxxxxCH...CXXCH cytochrome family protein